MNDQIIVEGPIFEDNTIGWICPKCGTVISPNVKTCPNCSSKQMNVKSNSYTSTTWDVNNLNSKEQMIFS